MHSRLEVEELKEWLSPSDQMLARLSSYDDMGYTLGTPRMAVSGERAPSTAEQLRAPTPNLPPFLIRSRDREWGIETLPRPWFVLGDEPSPSPLLLVSEWPREKERRRRFNPRRMESDEEDTTPLPAEIAVNPPEAMEVELVPPPAENEGRCLRGLVMKHHGGHHQPMDIRTYRTARPVEFCSGIFARYQLTERWTQTETDVLIAGHGGIRGSSAVNHEGSSVLIAAGEA